MSTSRSILIFAETETPMIKFIHQAIKEMHKELREEMEPHIVKRGQYECMNASENYVGSIWFFPDGEDFEYFGGEDVFEKKFEEYNKKYKLWICMGGANTTFTDLDTGEKSFYPIYYFRLLMEKIINSGIENDAYLTCVTSSGGDHKTYPKKIRSQWTGKFL